MNRAPHPCPHPECPALTTDKRGCERHRGPTKTVDRGYDAEWVAYSQAYLRRHRRCMKCGAGSRHVDHKIPVRAGIDRFDPRNHQALCSRCHNVKTARDNIEGHELARLY